MIKTHDISVKEQKELEEVLGSLGLKTNEQNVYLMMLSLGPNTISPLSKGVGLPLTTTQSIVHRLVDKGVVGFTKNKSRHIFYAEDPSAFRQIIREQERGLSNIVPILKKISSDKGGSQKIKIYNGDNVRKIFNEALGCKSKVVYEIVSPKDIQDILGEKLHFSRRRVLSGVRLKSLRVAKYEIKKYNKIVNAKELREAKFLPAELSFESSFMFWDDTVAFFTTKSGGLAWTVESKTMQKTFQQIFDLLWNISRTIS